MSRYVIFNINQIFKGSFVSTTTFLESQVNFRENKVTQLFLDVEKKLVDIIWRGVG